MSNFVDGFYIVLTNSSGCELDRKWVGCEEAIGKLISTLTAGDVPRWTIQAGDLIRVYEGVKEID